LRIALGSDHAGFRYKEIFKRALAQTGHDVDDIGTHGTRVTVIAPR